MTAPVVTTDGRPIVGAYGDVYTAPVGTPVPTDIESPGAAWTKLGLVSEDGATWNPSEEETSDIKAWQSPYPVRVVSTSLTSSVAFALMEWDRDTLPFALGGGTFSDVGDLVIFHPPAVGESTERALFMKILDNPIRMGLYYPKGRVTAREETTFKPDEPALLGLTFGLVGDINIAEPYNLVFDAETFPPAVGAPAVKSDAKPGDVFPVEPSIGASDATNAGELASLGYIANPQSAWTAGQQITVNTYAFHWSGATWVNGPAT